MKGTDHLPLIVHKSNHSAQSLGSVLGLEYKRSAYVFFLVSMCLSLCI